MTMTADNVLDGVAKDLLDAYRTGDPIAPPRETVDGLDLDGAYRIQQLQSRPSLTPAAPSSAARSV